MRIELGLCSSVRTLLMLSFILASSSCVLAQQQQHFVFHLGQVEVSGYTNNYNWKLKSDSLECKADLIVQSKQLKAIKSLHFAVQVKDLSSPNTYMDRIAHKSLKAYPFDKITFQHVKSEIIPMEDNAQFQIKSSGNMTIGGVTRLINMDLVASLINDGTVVFTGTQNLKLSTYQVSPKRTLMGTLKTNDEVRVDFILGMRPRASLK